MRETSAPGAPATDGSIPLCVPHISGNEWQYVKECLDTNWVSSVGSFVDRFEGELAAYVNSKFGVAVNSGTAALHIALMVAGAEADDEVLVSTLSFVAPANAIRYIGAWPVFMDADPRYWQMDAEKTQLFLENECIWRNGQLENKSTGRRVKAILPVHILGHPCDMEPIVKIAHDFNLTVIEDATESLGAGYKGNMVGHLGDIACFSFNGNKIITTGGGGMIVTDNQEWSDRARYLTTQAKDDPIEYVHNEIGYNYRLTNIQAAMGVAQLERLDEFVEKKRTIAAQYQEGLGDLDGIGLMAAQPDTNPVYWLYTALLGPSTSLEDRKLFVKELNEAGFGARPLWRPLHLLPPYEDCQSFMIDQAVSLYNRAVSLPSSVGLESDDQQRCISTFRALADSMKVLA
jgi:perosamine synthetase